MKKISISEIINKFMEEKKFIYSAGLYENMGNHFKKVPSEKVLKTIRNALPQDIAEEISTGALSEIAKQIATNYEFEVPEGKINPSAYLKVKNGVVDICKGELVAPKDCIFTYEANFNFIKNADVMNAQHFRKFLKASLDEGEKAELLLQILGYSISDLTAAKKAFFLIGPPDSGKSVFLDFVGKLMGEENCTYIPFHQIGTKFNKSRLAGSRINLCSELAGGRMRDVDAFKQITSCEKIMAERKGEMPFEFVVKTKLLSAGNVMPTFPELAGADAILKRLVILKFGKNSEKKDFRLPDLLWNERDIIGSLAVTALQKLIQRDFQFTEPEDTKAFQQELNLTYNCLNEFLAEQCELKSGSREHFVDLWDGFVKFRESNGYDSKITKLAFSQMIAELPGVTHRRFRKNGKSLRGFAGIALKREEGKKIIKAFHSQNGL